MSSQSSAGGQAPAVPYGVRLISSADASSSDLSASRVFASGADIEASTPSSLTLHTSTLRRHSDAFLVRLAEGFSFRKVTSDNTSGIWSLLLSFEDYMQKLSRSYNVDEAWSLLESYYLSQEYWADGLEYMYQRPSTRSEDLQAASSCTTAKLALFAQKLGKVHLTDGEQVDLVFLCPLNHGQAEHTISSSSIIDDAATFMTIFIFTGRSEYQAFLRDATGDKVQPDKTFTSRAQASARSKDTKAKHEGLPRGARLLWLTGMLENHPVLEFGQCPSPLTSAELERMFKLTDGAVVRKAIQKAKEAWKTEHGDTGLRKDLRSACKALPRSSLSAVSTKPVPRVGTKRKQEAAEADSTEAADHRPQKAPRQSGPRPLSFQQASLPSAPLPSSPPSWSAPAEIFTELPVTAHRSASRAEDSDPYPDPPERTWVRWPYPPFR